MAISSLPEKHFHVRSISLPTKSHPIALKLEQYLNKIKTWEISKSSTTSTSKAKTIQIGLDNLVELYNCINDFIHLPLAKAALIHPPLDKLVEGALDDSISLLDVCGTARDLVLMIKGGIQDLQSALRRKKGRDASMENQINAYISLRKKMKKDAKKTVAALKKMNDKYASPGLDQTQHKAVTVIVLREASMVTISFFQYLLSFVSSSVRKKKLVGWSLVSKLINNGSIACEKQENANEVEIVDVAVDTLCGHKSSSGVEVESVQTAQKCLRTLEISIEGLEDGLEYMYRRLIQTRVSLLNVLNQ